MDGLLELRPGGLAALADDGLKAHVHLQGRNYK
jgi:hypothetical protein